MAEVVQPTQGEDQATADICLPNPAFMPEWFWYPVANRLRNRGHNVIIPEIPRSSPDRTIEKEMHAMHESMEGLDSQFIVALSRGIEYLVRYLAELKRRGEVNKVLGGMAISTVGPRGYKTINPETGQPFTDAERHNQDYAEVLSPDGVDEYGREDLGPQAAQYMRDHTIPFKRWRQIFDDSVPQSPLTDAEVKAVPAFVGLRAFSWYIGRKDRVDNLEHSAAAARQHFDTEPKYMGWGHVGPLSHPDEVTDVIHREVQRAAKIRAGEK